MHRRVFTINCVIQLTHTLRDENIKSVTKVKYLGIVVDAELADDKDIMRQLHYQYCAANKLSLIHI